MNKHLPLHRRESPGGRVRRLSRKQWVICVCIVILLFVLFRSGKRESTDTYQRIPTPYRIDWSAWPTNLSKPNDESSIFSTLQFETDAVYDSDADLKTVTAIVYRVSNNIQNIINTVHHLTKYPFIREIYIHSPMGMPKLTLEDLQVDADLVNIQLFDETNERLGSLARFTTCAMATNEYCYFQNDKWRNLHLDSLYLNFARYPNLVHATAPPATYLDQLRWRMTNPDVSMHAGYADLQYGAFAPRWKAQTFMTQLGKSSLIKDRLRMADMYFSLWTNQYPWLLSNPVAVASDNTDATYTWPGNLRSNLNQAARKLYHILEATTEETPKDYVERPEEVPYLDERDVRASCKSDRCLFITNIDILPDPSNLHFTNANYSGIPEYEEMYNSLAQSPSSDLWDAHGYHMAVDQDPATCWNSFHYPKSGTYFGLLLMGNLDMKSVDIMTRNDIRQAEDLFEVSVTSNGTQWETCGATATTSWQSSPTKLHIELECGDVAARAVRFRFTRDQSEPFNVCSITLDTFSV